MVHYDTLLMRQVLVQNPTAILLKNATKVYCKCNQVFYCKMRQLYYKIRQLLQNAPILLQKPTFIKACGTFFIIIFYFPWPLIHYPREAQTIKKCLQLNQIISFTHLLSAIFWLGTIAQKTLQSLPRNVLQKADTSI